MAFWIFGGKKKDEKPVTVEAIEVGSDESFTIVQKNTDERGLYPVVPSSPYPSSQFYTPLPYSVLPPCPTGQQAVVNSTRTSVQNQLDNVPFLLSSKLEQGSKQSSELLNGIEDLRRAIVQIAADINDTIFDYDFKLERTVLEEASIYKNSNNN